MKQINKRFFGTDGIRGRVGQPPITPEFMLKLGWAAGKVLARQGKQSVVIGKDTRISGYMFESALQAGLSAAGVDVYLLGPMPTPGIAYLTRTMHAAAGIVISASHNPYHDNGIKFFSSEGEKLPHETEQAIEAMLDQSMDTVDSKRLGKATRIDDAAGRYIEFCKRAMPIQTSLSGLKIVVDCAHGATYHIAPKVYRELGAEVVPVADQPNGLNINEGCGSLHPELLQKAVLEHQADMGIALDGDGDRVMMVSHDGRVLDGDDLLYIIAVSRHEQKEDIPVVVGTLMSNLGLEQALQKLGVGFVRTQVGDRYVHEHMKAQGLLLGGETSGHILCLDKTTTGDGIMASLEVIYQALKKNQTLHELCAGWHKYPQHMINVQMKEKIDLDGSPLIQRAVEEVEATLEGRGRVVLRPSGTEPVIRVMVEAEDERMAKAMTEQLSAVIKTQAD